jgi:hypothetical protein
MSGRRFFLIIIFSTLTLYSIQSFSQRFLGALSFGMNLTQVDGDEKFGYKKAGLNVGPSIILPIGKNKKWSVTMELLFSQMGSRQRSSYAANDTLADSSRTGYYDGYRLSLNYIQVPVLVHFTDKRVIAGGIGFSFSRLVGVNEYEDYNDPRGWVKTATSLSGPYSKSDFQVLADVRLRVWKKLWLNLRYSYSMDHIRERHYYVKIPNSYKQWDRFQYNNVITLRLVYIFNDILPDKHKKRADENE